VARDVEFGSRAVADDYRDVLPRVQFIDAILLLSDRILGRRRGRWWEAATVLLFSSLRSD
jgi:hypothetical protein